MTRQELRIRPKCTEKNGCSNFNLNNVKMVDFYLSVRLIKCLSEDDDPSPSITPATHAQACDAFQ